MHALYNITVNLTKAVLPFTTGISPKMKLFVEGRKNTFSILKQKLNTSQKVIWFHMASLGEFEQGLPIIEIVKKMHPEHKILVSFFSPSGYENKKNTPVADAVVYLPLDTPKNAKRFLDAVKPEMVFFIKYEFWPNYLKELKNRSVPTYLISGGFRKDQIFFRSYGGWMRKSLKTFEHFFVQNPGSLELLQSIGYNNVTVTGDTRFDRVSRQLEQDNYLESIEKFKNNQLCLVAGSIWPEDEALLEDFINSAPDTLRFILAPHEINSEKINLLKQRLRKKTVLYSERESKDLANFQVLIIDNIGLLARIYSYADIAYVGGAAGNTGLHNILEPATFGIPIVIGENFEDFPEAIKLQNLAGLYSVNNRKELSEVLTRFTEDENFRKQTGMIAGHFINSNTGATKSVAGYLKNKNKLI